MNSKPFYAIWDTSLGTWYGGSIRWTTKHDKELAIEFCNSIISKPAPHHSYIVVEINGATFPDKNIYFRTT